MNKNIVFLLFVVVLSLPFWAGVNVLQEKTEAFIYDAQLAKSPSIEIATNTLVANIAEQVPKYPDYYLDLKDYKLQAKSIISVEIDKNGNENIIFQKNTNEKLPIASLTKLITASVAFEFYQKAEQIEISENAVLQLEKTGFLKQGETLSLDGLLHSMLIESSNDAAYAITDLVGTNGFVGLMNIFARDIGMTDSYFYNPNGLDPDDLNMEENEINYSTAMDLVKLSKYLLKKYPEIFEISSKEKYDLYLENGWFHHTLYNTNELIWELDNIVGSKTGLTERAGGCLFTILENKEKESLIINIILNSSDRFQDMRKLVTYAFD
jgi:D-alanyl-D-alanine carboxypeptidase